MRCGVRPRAPRESLVLRVPRIFTDRRPGTGHVLPDWLPSGQWRCFSSGATPSPVDPLPGCRQYGEYLGSFLLKRTNPALSKKKSRQFFPGRAPACPSFLSLPITRQSLALFQYMAGCRNVNLLPFRVVVCSTSRGLAPTQHQRPSLRQRKHNTQDRLTHGQALFP